MKSIVFCISFLFSTCAFAQWQVGWEVGVNMTDTDFTQDLGNNYNQHIGTNGAIIVRRKIGKYFHGNLKSQLSVERVSTFIRFPNQQIYWRLTPTIEYDVAKHFSVSAGLNGGFKMLEYSFNSYGQNRRFDGFSLRENRSNLRLQFGGKYIKKRAYIFSNVTFEILSEIENFDLTNPLPNFSQNTGLLEVGLGYQLDFQNFQKVLSNLKF